MPTSATAATGEAQGHDHRQRRCGPDPRLSVHGKTPAAGCCTHNQQ
ncbi:hypothetical protein AWT69_004326 [Pseudomonas putida]|nr:hypothetical protein AWT69_004326 [Pseudomonas putida]